MQRIVIIGAGLAAILTACGYPTAVAPTAKEVLAKPLQSNLKDAHFVVSGKLSNNGATVNVTGDGEINYKPKPGGRFKFITTVAGQVVSFEQISVGGTDYGIQTPGAAKWVSKADPTGGIGPTVFAGASAQKYIGEENLPQGKAWHASAKDSTGNPFEAYIRESDGYPIKYVETQSGGDSITLTFDKYNSGTTITPPPSAQVTPG
ncbi:MAG TPA: hypothetical protein VGD57_06260 [Candidatus Dormibacteraeota bacterium]